MSRRILSLLFAVIILLSIPFQAHAATPRVVTMTSGIEFNGETALCKLIVCGEYATDDIYAVVRLFDENDKLVRTWVQSGTGYLNFSRTTELVSGVTYTLKSFVTVNGVEKPAITTTRTCP